MKVECMDMGEGLEVHRGPERDPTRLPSPLDYLRIMLRYWWLIAAVCGLVIGATLLAILLSPIEYEATASLVPPLELLAQQPGNSALAAAKRTLGSAALGMTSLGDMYIGILRSRAVQDAVIDKCDLMRVYKVSGRQAARKQLGGRTDFRTSRESIVYLAVRDEDPNRAATMAGCFLDELDKRIKALSVGRAASKRVFLERRLADLQQEMGKFDDLLSREAKVKEMLYEVLTQEYEMAKIEEARDMPTIQVLDPPMVPESRMGRGARVKLFFAAVASLAFGVFLAFGWEYVKQLRREERSRAGLSEAMGA